MFQYRSKVQYTFQPISVNATWIEVEKITYSCTYVIVSFIRSLFSRAVVFQFFTLFYFLMYFVSKSFFEGFSNNLIIPEGDIYLKDIESLERQSTQCWQPFRWDMSTIWTQLLRLNHWSLNKITIYRVYQKKITVEVYIVYSQPLFVWPKIN